MELLCRHCCLMAHLFGGWGNEGWDGILHPLQFLSILSSILSYVWTSIKIRNEIVLAVTRYSYLKKGQAGVIHFGQNMFHVILEPDATFIFTKKWKNLFQFALFFELKGRGNSMKLRQIFHYIFNEYCSQFNSINQLEKGTSNRLYSVSS